MRKREVDGARGCMTTGDLDGDGDAVSKQPELVAFVKFTSPLWMRLTGGTVAAF